MEMRQEDGEIISIEPPSTAMEMSFNMFGDFLSSLGKQFSASLSLNPISQARKREAEESVEQLNQTMRQTTKRVSAAANQLTSSARTWFQQVMGYDLGEPETQEKREAKFRDFWIQQREDEALSRPPISSEVLWDKRPSETEPSKPVDDEPFTSNDVEDLISNFTVSHTRRMSQMQQQMEEDKKRHEAYKFKLKSENNLDESDADAEFSYLIPGKEITADEEQLIHSKFGSGHNDDVVCERFDAPITKHCLRTVELGRWVNDEIVNCFLQLCARRYGVDQADRPYLFSSFFLTKLVHPKKGYDYAEVQRWTARGKGKADLFARRAVFFPVNINNTHWCLAVADVKFKRITYYDSMGGEGRQVLNNLWRYFQDEHKAKKNQDIADTWELVSPRKDVPQQSNCNDCGIFTCTFGNVLMEYFSKHSDATPSSNIFCFSYEDMPRIRQQIQLDVIRDAVYPS